jgi:hypothetical protein
LIIRSEKGVTAESLANIYKALGQVIKDEACFYTKDELADLKKNRDFIKLGGAKNG